MVETDEKRKTMNRGSRLAKIILLPLLLVAAMPACSTLGAAKQSVGRIVRKLLGQPDDPYAKPIPEAPAAYRAAFDKLEAMHYEEAISGFSNFLLQDPTTNWTLAAQFNWGRALEGLGRLAEAEKKYSETAKKAGSTPKLQGLALLRQAVVLEAMGDEDRSLAALIDAEKRAAQMAPEVALTELPARLAAAYAREKNMPEAERYFAMADRQLSRLRAEAGKDAAPEWLPRILYAMGHRPPGVVAWDRFDEAVVPIERSQMYLLQSAEMGVEPWAGQAADELIGAYSALRKAIDGVPTPAATELIIAAREQQKLRWERLVRLADAVARLRTLFVTEIVGASPEGSPIRRIVDFADSMDENLQAALMLERPVGNEETPEAAARKRRVRTSTIGPSPVFPNEKGTVEKGQSE